MNQNILKNNMRNEKNIRTCLGCHKKTNKYSLYRIASIKKDDNKKNIVLDIEQNQGGRGAYLCSLECLEKSTENKFLQSRLRSHVSMEDIINIKEEIKKRPRGKNE